MTTTIAIAATAVASTIGRSRLIWQFGLRLWLAPSPTREAVMAAFAKSWRRE
jgi:hypothetical protein